MAAWVTVKIKTQKKDPFPNQEMGSYKDEPYPLHTNAYEGLRFTDEDEAIKLFWQLQKILKKHRKMEVKK